MKIHSESDIVHTAQYTEELAQLKHKILTDFVSSDGRINGKKLLAPENKQVFTEIHNATKCLDESYNMRARVQFVLELRTSVPVCCMCSKPTVYNKQVQTFNRHCSAKCAQIDPATRKKNEDTCMQRYGVRAGCIAPSAIEKQEATNLERYGVRRPFQSSDIQRKVTNTVRAMGVTSTALLDHVREQQEATNLERYGVKKPFESAEIQQKINETFMHSINVLRPAMQVIPPSSYNILNDPAALYDLHVVQQKPHTRIGIELNTTGSTVGKYMQRHNIKARYFVVSEGEKEVGDFVENLGISIERNTRGIISPKEIDIYIPSHNLAIEFCGVYWHGEKQGKHRTYHKEKHTNCKEKGIQLLTIYDWEWVNRRIQVEQKLRSLLGKNDKVTYARKCSVCSLSTSQKRDFFEQYHVQGSGPGSINYGLIINSELVAAMSVIDTEQEYIINRYASKDRVVGGFSKLLNHFQKIHKRKTIVSFADLRWSNGGMYESTGFELDGEIPPDYAYIINGKPMHKFAFRHSALKNKLLNYDPSKSEWENMKNHGYDRIWDCGKLRYVIEK